MNPDCRQLFNGVREILNRHDLEQLLKLGAPEDEYDPEVERVLPQLAAASDATDVATIVQDVFTKMFDHRPSDATVAAAADEIWATYQGAVTLHSPEDISLRLAQKTPGSIVLRLRMARLLLAGVLVHGADIGMLIRLLRAIGASELAERLRQAQMHAKMRLDQRRPLLGAAEPSNLWLQIEAGDFELVERLDRDADELAMPLALTISERTAILDLIEDPPDELSGLRAVLLNEYQWRQRTELDS